MSSKNLTYTELIRKLSRDLNITQREVDRVLSETLKVIGEEMGSGGRVSIRDFGVFETRVRGAKQSRNIHTGKLTTRPEQRVMKFRPAKNLKEDIRGRV